MAMSPRLLRPKAAGNTVPQFTTQGYARVWGVTTKSTGNVTGTADTDTGYYAVKWWDNTTTVYDSGDPFSKAAAGNQRAFEVYPSDATGDPEGQFDGFDVSGNALTQVRSEGVTLTGTTGTPTVYGYYAPPYYTVYIPGTPGVPASYEGGTVSNNLLSSVALDQFYTDLDSGSGHLFVAGNPGIVADTPTIATAKGYTVFGSVPPETSLLLNFNGNLTDSSPNAVVLTAYNGAAVSTTQSKWGGSSLFLDTDSYLTGAGGESVVDFDGGAGTVEAWVYLTSHVPSGQYGGIVAPLALEAGSGLGFGLGHFSGQSVLAATYIDAGAGGAGLLSLEEWHHVAYAVDDDGVTLRYFLDGVLTTTHTLTGASDQLGVTIGNILPTTLTGFVGFVDDLRIVKGVALYTANFTPPTAQLGVYP
jgi:hypothetical protein